MPDRRSILAGAISMAATACTANDFGLQSQVDFVAKLRSLEELAGGQLGAFVIDTRSGKTLGWRASQRFCHCSTFKTSLAAFVLKEADAGRIDLSETLPFGQSDILSYAPVVKANLGAGELSILTLTEAVQVMSDNSATNLLMRRLGGPEVMTEFWREIGDEISRIDGYEPEINVIPPGTQENSTTPEAMAHTLSKIVLGDVLSAESRDRIWNWMSRTRTGMRRIRAGIPQTWGGMDKTGTSMSHAAGNKTNDIAILLPPNGKAPLVVTGYFEHPEYSRSVRAPDEAVLKALGELAVDWSKEV